MTLSPDMAIRPGREADLPELTAIYNHYVVETHVTFDVEPFTVEARRAWFDQFAPGGRLQLHVLDEAGRVLGYAASTPFKPKPAYRTSVETSIYLAPAAVGRGLGGPLYESLLAALPAAGLHRAFAGVALPNPASIALHERLGFEPVGTFDEAGFKRGLFHSVRWYGKRL